MKKVRAYGTPESEKKKGDEDMLFIENAKLSNVNILMSISLFG